MSENNTDELQPAPPSAEIIQHVLLGGDLTRLTAAQRLSYYQSVCASLGLNPLTRPFDYLRLSGREILYAKKDAAEQLRQKHAVSVSIARGELVDGLYVVWADARLPNGRTDADMGAVDVSTLKGDARCNAMMKAVTKAKRRATLSICGLGLLDESELETIPEARPLHFDPTTGEVHEPAPPRPAPSSKTISEAQQKKLFAVAREHGWGKDDIRTHLREHHGIQKSNELTVDRFDQVLAELMDGPRRHRDGD